MKFIVIFTAMAIMFFAGDIKAQTIRVDTTRHEQGSTEVIVFSRDASRTKLSKAEKANNIVKIGLTTWVSGVIPFYYERKIFPWLSVQGGVGLTTRDFVADVINIIFVDEPNYSPYYTYNERKALVGYYLSFQPKFYVKKEALGSFWLSPMIEFKRYNFKANEVDEFNSNLNTGGPSYLPNTYMMEHRNAVDFTLNLGWQWMFDPLIVEFSMGAGFRRFWEQRLDIQSVSYSTGQIYVNEARYYGNFRPELNLSLNFGGFF